MLIVLLSISNGLEELHYVEKNEMKGHKSCYRLARMLSIIERGSAQTRVKNSIQGDIMVVLLEAMDDILRPLTSACRAYVEPQ